MPYDSWKLDTPDNHLKFHCYCDECVQDIYKGQEYIKADCGNFCDTFCLKEYVNAEYKVAE